MNQACALPRFQNRFKVTVVGCGNVGATAAYAMLIDGTPTELVLMDVSKEKAEGVMLDFQHSMSFFEYTKLSATDKYQDAIESDLIVITAGARQKEGETRLDLIAKNREIIESMIPKLVTVAPKAIFLIVSNPVDILTNLAHEVSGLPHGRVFGSGTMLDTARLRFHLSEKLCVSPKSIEAFVLGEHGDTSFPVWSSANVAGQPLFNLKNFSQDLADEAYQETKNAAYRIIHDIGFTCYSIGIVIREIMSHIFRHSRVVLPLSIPLNGAYGFNDIALSVPCVLDSNGVSEIMEIPLNDKEKADLQKSITTLKAVQG